jgi:hypothetical protein
MHVRRHVYLILIYATYIGIGYVSKSVDPWYGIDSYDIMLTYVPLMRQICSNHQGEEGRV